MDFNSEDLKVAAIGKTMAETEDLEWSQYWPVLDESRIIVDVVCSDEIPDDDDLTVFLFVDGQLIETDTNSHYDAILRWWH